MRASAGGPAPPERAGGRRGEGPHPKGGASRGGSGPLDGGTRGDEARKEDAIAAWHSQRYDPNAGAPTPFCLGRTEPCWTSIANPTAEHLQRAEEHRRHAADHRAASKALRDAQ